MTAHLAPCPFCGGAAAVQPWVDPPAVGGTIARIRCTRCSAQSAPYADASYASEAWNRRAPALHWRREPPDVPGWWLIYERDGESRVVRVVDPAYYSTTEARERAAVYGWRWLGPIPEPEEAE